ncbi:hypothetical protein [Oceanobacillus sojae]|uniref:hypothetical protein n=1 Tax=Oceanobacillus sojae TaxID=582851 RepID=UPI0009883AE5|nr:hypothetical protein [Oceanobacillus sojae]
MNEKLNEIIEKYEEKLAVITVSLEEIQEMREDDFNPADASGGNFDDAYEMGRYDGDIEGEYSALYDVVKDLKALKEAE